MITGRGEDGPDSEGLLVKVPACGCRLDRIRQPGLRQDVRQEGMRGGVAPDLVVNRDRPLRLVAESTHRKIQPSVLQLTPWS